MKRSQLSSAGKQMLLSYTGKVEEVAPAQTPGERFVSELDLNNGCILSLGHDEAILAFTTS